MPITIGSNIASIRSQRRLAEGTANLSSTFEKLSSGQRINKASDDAAGLAIADELNAKSKIYTQGIRNGNDGLSLLNIADSAIDTLAGVVTRIRELSEQAANGTYSAVQREALDKEAQALSEEFTRITKTTSFNGIRLFDGSLGSGVRLQVGVGLAESINASVGGAIGTGRFEARTTIGTGVSPFAVTLGDLNGDGVLDIVTADPGSDTASIMLGNGDGTFQARTSILIGDNPVSVTLGDLNDDGFLDIVTADGAGSSTNSIMLGNGDGTFRARTSIGDTGIFPGLVTLGDLNGDGILDIVTADNNLNTASIRLGNGDGTFRDEISINTGSSPQAVTLGDLNGDGILDIVTADYSDRTASIMLGNGDGTFQARTSISTSVEPLSLTLGDLNGDGVLDIVTSDYDNTTVSVRLGNGNGTFQARISIEMGAEPLSATLGDLNGDGVLDIITADDSNSARIRLGNGDGTFQALSLAGATGGSPSSVTLGDLNGDGVLDIVTTQSNNTASIFIAKTESGLGALLEFSLKTKSDALQSMGMLDRTLENLAKQRGTIGASQSRVGIAISNLQTAKENFAAAESRIRDADIASESANLVRSQILQQVASSVLAQANQAPQLALTLLR